MNNSSVILKAEKLCFSYDQDANPVLNNLKLELSQGEIVSIYGPSGSGKSSLLNLLGLLNKPDSGDVFWQGRSTSSLGDYDRTMLRRNVIGFVYQFHHLLPEFSILENVAIPLVINGMSMQKAKERADALLRRLDIVELSGAMPTSVSGGQRQRAAICRGLIHSPLLVIMDEPTGSLDDKNTEKTIELIQSIRDEFKTTFLIATHDKAFEAFSDRVDVLRSGQILRI